MLVIKSTSDHSGHSDGRAMIYNKSTHGYIVC